MIRNLRPALSSFVFLALLCGAAYPAVVTLLGQTAFPTQAGGDLVAINGKIVGARLIGQAFVSEQYFHGRPSAAGSGYDASASGASNLAPGAPALLKTVTARVAELRPEDKGVKIPVDLVTSSASGLDPDISLAAAMFQAERVAKARNLPPQKVKALVTQHIEKPWAGFLGQTRVNVLALNLDLDRLAAEAP